ncbi:hypothetical protein VNO77_03910 [Canavalia gladiata]|uniref:Uncharacterized protein n=1 Tax=Canavalia gladiata TaxID=3824 RepID=A0AAN9MXL8_CANGL
MQGSRWLIWTTEICFQVFQDQSQITGLVPTVGPYDMDNVTANCLSIRIGLLRPGESPMIEAFADLAWILRVTILIHASVHPNGTNISGAIDGILDLCPLAIDLCFLRLSWAEPEPKQFQSWCERLGDL